MLTQMETLLQVSNIYTIALRERVVLTPPTLQL